MKISELEGMTSRDRLSEYLPWVAYDSRNGMYINADDTVGFLLELSPTPFSGEKTVDALDSIFSLQWPTGTIIQMILFADPYQIPLLEGYLLERNRGIGGGGWDSSTIGFLADWTRNYCGYLMEHRHHGISAEIPVPFRNFRVFMSVKCPCPTHKIDDMTKRLQGLKEPVMGTLKTGGLFAEELPPHVLIHWMHRMFNPGHRYMDRLMYDDGDMIRNQIIEADTVIRRGKDFLEVDGTYVKIKTPKINKADPTCYNTNLLAGDIFTANLQQIPCPFMLTLNLQMVDSRKMIEKKASIVLAQQAFSKVAPKLQRKQTEFSKAMNHIEDGARYINGYYTMVFFENDRDALRQAESTIDAVFQAQGYKLQDDTYLSLPLFLAAMPFGLYEKAVSALGRMKPASTDTFSVLAPVQADWRGTETPVMQFISRRGQVMHLDFRDSPTNYNVMVAAESGAGKSFLMNYVVMNYLSVGGQVFIIDIGRSYKKLCDMLGGQYIEFTKDARISMNVFSEVSKDQVVEALDSDSMRGVAAGTARADDLDKGDVESTLNMFVRLLAQMGKPRQAIDDYEYSLLTNVVASAYQKLGDGELMTPDHFHRELKEREKSIREKNINDNRTSDWVEMLEKYTRGGQFGHWFDGPVNLDFNKPLVVLELEELNGLPELREVVLLLIMSIIDQKMYFSDKSVPKLVIIDEAWQLLRGANTGNFIESGYRRARKYGGMFVTITQSIMDFYSSDNAGVGQAIMSNSAYKMFLSQPSEDIERAVKDDKLVLSDFEKRLLLSVHTRPGYYSEIFIKSEGRFGVGRLFVDKFTQILFNTNPRVVQFVQDQREAGVDLAEAINLAIKRDILNIG